MVVGREGSASKFVTEFCSMPVFECIEIFQFAENKERKSVISQHIYSAVGDNEAWSDKFIVGRKRNRSKWQPGELIFLFVWIRSDQINFSHPHDFIMIDAHRSESQTSGGCIPGIFQRDGNFPIVRRI